MTFTSALWLFPIALLVAFPILLWGYIFSYLDNSPLNIRRFGIGLFAGALSVVPVLFLEDLLRITRLTALDPFVLLAGNIGILSIAFGVFGSLVVVAAVLFLIGVLLFSRGSGYPLGVYTKSLGLFFGACIAIFSVLALLRAFPIANLPYGEGVSAGGKILTAFWAVLAYYVIVGLTEEGSKHWSFLMSSLRDASTIHQGIIFSVFVALGFAFVENILYLATIREHTEGFSGTFFVAWSMRSIFSTFVHVFSGAILAHAFFRIYLAYPHYRIIGVEAHHILISGILLSTLVHAIFDVALTGGFTAIIFLYAVIGYLGITGMLYGRERGGGESG